MHLSWARQQAETKVTWGGFELLHSTWRAARFIKWAEDVASSHTVNTASDEDGLGRFMYVAEALEHERPFLSLLYSFLALHPMRVVRKVPAYVKYFLRYLSRHVSRSRHYD